LHAAVIGLHRDDVQSQALVSLYQLLTVLLGAAPCCRIDNAGYPLSPGFNRCRMDRWLCLPAVMLRVQVDAIHCPVPGAPHAGCFLPTYVKGIGSWPVVRNLERLTQDFGELDRVDRAGTQRRD